MVVRRFRHSQLLAALQRWRESIAESVAVGSKAKTVVKRWRGSALGKSFERWCEALRLKQMKHLPPRTVCQPQRLASHRTRVPQRGCDMLRADEGE